MDRDIGIYAELLSRIARVPRIEPVPDASAEHGQVHLAVAVIVTGNRFVAILPELHPGILVINASEPVPGTVRRTEHRWFVFCVTIIVTGLRNIAREAKVHEQDSVVTAV